MSKSVYEMVTDRIIEQLESGVIPRYFQDTRKIHSFAHHGMA